MVAAAPTSDPQAAAVATMMVESMGSGTGVEEQDIQSGHGHVNTHPRWVF
jgi:hypothetical protein